MLLVMGGTAYYCHRLLSDATAGGSVAESSLFVPFAALLVVGSMVVVVFQSLHVANRVAGPERRLAQAMQRMRRGDLAFRIHLRRGDLLTPLARECNELLEWLNENPPAGAEVGSDVVSVDTQEVDDEFANASDPIAAGGAR
jgi:hypothetical protein